MPKPVLAAAMVISFLAGIGVHSNFWIQWPSATAQTATIVYKSEIGSDLALSIDSKGKMTFGSEYDRNAEARKLLDVAKQLADADKSLPCTNTNYRPPIGGVITVQPGTAWPNDALEGSGEYERSLGQKLADLILEL